MMDFHSDKTLSDVIRGELNARLSSRYTLKNFSDDTGLKYYTLWRFVNRKPVSEQFINDLYAILAKTSI